MKSIFKSSSKRLAIISTLLIGCLAFSFQDTPIVNQILNERKSAPDTIPTVKNKEALTITEYNQMLTALNESMEHLGISLSSLNNDLIRQHAMTALESINLSKMSDQIKQSLQSLEMDKMLEQAELALRNSSLSSLNGEFSLAMEQAAKEMQKAKTEMKSVNFAEIDKEMKMAAKELEKAKSEIRKIDVNKIMAEADSELKKARTEMNLTSALFAELEKDGLINTKKGFTIVYENKTLYINGIKQSESTTERYRRYFNSDKFEITIKAEK